MEIEQSNLNLSSRAKFETGAFPSALVWPGDDLIRPKWKELERGTENK